MVNRFGCNGRQLAIKIDFKICRMFYLKSHQFPANLAKLIGRRNGQHDKVWRIIFAGDQPMSGGFYRRMDRLSRTMARGR